MNNYMEIVNALNLEPKGNAFVGEIEGYRYSFIAQPNALLGGVIRFVFDQPIEKQEAAIIRKSTKGIVQFDRFANAKDTVVLALMNRGRKTMDQYATFLTDLLKAYAAGFRNAGLRQSTSCAVCNQILPEEDVVWKVFNGYYVQMHDSCADKMIAKVTQEVALEQKRWYLLPLSLIFAFLGGIVGLIPAVIALFSVGYYVGLLYALVPLAAIAGYKLGKAPKNALMIVSVIVITLVLSAGFVLVTYAMSAAYMDLTFAEAMQSDAEFAASFQSNFTTSLIFGALGVWIAWRGISKTSRGKLDAVQSLKNQ
jgi:hypothetical protein